MSECLVTTLKESVSDSSLLHIDEVAIPYKNSTGTVKEMSLKANGIHNNPGTVTIEGDGHFTDSTGTQNYGKTIIIPTSSETIVYILSNKCNLHLRNKYDFSRISNGNHPTGNGIELNDDLISGMDLWSSFTPYSGNIETMLNLPNLDSIGMYVGSGEKKYGDISAVSDKMRDFNLHDGQNVTGNISVLASRSAIINIELLNCPKLTGNISAFQGNTQLKRFYIYGSLNFKGDLNAFSGNTKIENLGVGNTGVTGNISSLAGCTSLTRLNVNNTNIVGDTSSLRNLTNLTTFTYTNTAITGTWPLT